MPSETEVHVIKRFAKEGWNFAQVEVLPRTGRKHQIRIHLAHLGHPIVGDKLYGGDEQLYLKFVQGLLTPEDWEKLILPNHALHARSVELRWEGDAARFQAEPEPWFIDFVGA